MATEKTDWRPTFPRKRTDTEPVGRNEQRARWDFLAGYYLWCARQELPPTGRNPLTGLPWSSFDPLARRLGRAQNIALAREALDISRSFGTYPLP